MSVFVRPRILDGLTSRSLKFDPLPNVTNGIIEKTIITENRNGVAFRTQYPGKENSENNSIRNNIITFNKEDGIHFEHTLYGHHSNNIIFNNSILSNNIGVYMIMSANNQLIYNNIISNEIGVTLDMCMGGGENNKIHHNNFFTNGENHAFEWGGPLNHWDDGYPSGGNYWDNYTGVDSDGDGIGDTPYPIPGGDNEDRYPLMKPSGDIPEFLVEIKGGIGLHILIKNYRNDPS